MVKIVYFPGVHESPFDQLRVEPPFEKLRDFIVCDVGLCGGARLYIDLLRAIIEGRHPPIDEVGNSWHTTADAEWTTLRPEWNPDVEPMRLPTTWLLDAIERWRQYLIADGADPEI